jgi:hypothetical protein
MGQAPSFFNQFRNVSSVGSPGPRGLDGPKKALLGAAAAAAVVVLAGTGWMLLGSGTQDTASIAIATHQPLSRTKSASATATSAKPSKALRTTGRNPFQGSGANPATGTSSSTSSSSVSSSSSTSSATATVTLTSAPVYAVLMSLTSTSPVKGVFWVNDAKFTVTAGAKFDSGAFTFVSKTSSTCAKVKYSGTVHTLCIGEVTLVS